MHTYTVTIGRNVGTTPMSDTDWRDAQTDIHQALRYVLGRTPSIESHYGTGTWDGVTEESVKVTALSEHGITDEAIAILRARLRVIAARYSQDAIALQMCESELIAAREGVTA